MADFEIDRRDLLKATGIGAIGSTFVSPAKSASGLNVTLRQIIRPEFPEVTTFASVRDENGSPVTGLSASDFTVEEDGTPQTIQSVTSPESVDSSNVSVSLVIDRSGSMDGTPLANAKDAAQEFVKNFKSDDEGFVIEFDDVVTITQRWTKDEQELQNAIEGIQSDGRTKLWGAAIEGIQAAEPRLGRSAVIVLTDGEDNESSSTVNDVINEAQSSGVPVYTIGLGSGIAASDLKQLANETGGEYYETPTSSELTTIYNEISQSLKSEYEITYTTTNTATDGTLRTVSLTATAGGSSGSDTGTYEAPCAPLPDAAFSFSPSTAIVGQEVSFDGTASVPNGGSLVAHEWDFNNNGLVQATGETATHTYSKAGTYEVRLTVEKGCGAQDVAVKPIKVTDADLEITIQDINEPITAGETLVVDAAIENISSQSQTAAVTLLEFSGSSVGGEAVQLAPGETATVTLEWQTESDDAGTGEITVFAGEAQATRVVTIKQSSSSNFDQLVEEKLGPGGVAEQIDSTSVIASVSNDLGADVGDKPLAESTINDLRDEMESSSISEGTAEDAVQRMLLGEESILKTLQFMGSSTAGFDTDPDNDIGPPGTPDDPINYSKRVSKYLVETLLAVLTYADGILDVVFQRLPGWAQSLINLGGNNILQSLRDDAITSFIANSISVGDARERSKDKILGHSHEIVNKIANGVYNTSQDIANAIGEVFDTVGDAIADFVQAGFETGAIQVITSPAGIATVGGLATGSSTVWGAVERINTEYQPSNLPQSGNLPGNTSTAGKSKSDGIEYMRTLMDNSREWLMWIRGKILDFGLISNLREGIQDIVDIIQDLGDWDFVGLLANSASLTINTVQFVIGILSGIAGLLTSAGAAASVTSITSASGVILGQVITDIIEGQQTPLDDMPNLPDQDKVFQAGGNQVPDWASQFASELESGI